LDDLIINHELGHTIFSFGPREKKDLKIAYLCEALADGFSIGTYLDENGDPGKVQDFIDIRRLGAFIGRTLPKYWTARACEAVLRKEEIPSLKEAFDITRELQLCVDENLYPTGKRRKVWEDTLLDSKRVPYLPFEKPSSEIMKALKHVVDKAELSAATREEGKKILDAYKRLCPLEAKRVLCPSKTAPRNQLNQNIF
jgi:hypothetical protein